MQGTLGPLVPRTTADIVFDKLREEIISSKILPQTKISEAEIAKRFGVSRQPVRDAFTRLAHLDLLHIRPQRPTVVRGFSIQDIESARFVRLAVELEVVTRACRAWDQNMAEKLESNLAQQQAMIDADRTEQFHELDYQFHRLICEFSGFSLAYNVIETSKRKVDRLCMLSLGRTEEVSEILEDHQKIARALESGAVEEVRELTRNHLARLDKTIEEIHETHSDFFE